eukprot:4820154-Amphidinium_carterae.1
MASIYASAFGRSMLLMLQVTFYGGRTLLQGTCADMLLSMSHIASSDELEALASWCQACCMPGSKSLHVSTSVRCHAGSSRLVSMRC